MSTGTNSEVVLMVCLELHPEHKDEWLQQFTTLVDFVRDSEPHTLAYHVYYDNKDSNKVWLYERYVNEHAWHEVHEKSETFLRVFSPSNVQRFLKSVQINSMTEAGMGFLSR